MDTLTFISNIVASIAWPACVIVVALLFKEQLTDLLGRMVKGKIPGGEFEFSDSAKHQLANADQAEVPPLDDPDSSGHEQYSMDAAYQLLEALPRAAVIEGWRQLNAAALDRVIDIYEEMSSSSEDMEDFRLRQPPPSRVMGYLRQHNLLSSDQLALYEELRRLRNQAVHADDFDLTYEKAKEYLILTELLLDKLRE